MKTVSYLHLTSTSRASESTEDVHVRVNFNLFADLNWKKLSSAAAMPLVFVTLTLAILNIAEQALALQKIGSTGSQVTNTQRCLKNLGYFNGPVTGKFASLTQNAVIRFQQANRLPTDGVIGTNTQRVLQSQCQSRTPGGSVSGEVRLGSRGSAVTRLQQDLRRLGFFNGPITGYFGSETAASVIRFQQLSGIRADGTVGTRTKEAIRISLNRIERPDGVGGGDNLPNALNVGDSGSGVTELQENLRQLGYFNANPTGNFGPTTRDAVARFQQNYGLTPSGVADSQTLTVIITALGRLNPGCSTASGDICLGERSQRVTTVQQRLRDRGFFNGDITGYYGPATRDSVAQFQRYYRLEATGLVNFQTWEALGLSNSGNPTSGNPQSKNRYVVVVPMYSNDTLSKVRQFVPEAFAADSRLGSYVNAGQFSDRSEAERLSRLLRDRGLDARVEYF